MDLHYQCLTCSYFCYLGVAACLPAPCMYNNPGPVSTAALHSTALAPPDKASRDGETPTSPMYSLASFLPLQCAEGEGWGVTWTFMQYVIIVVIMGRCEMQELKTSILYQIQKGCTCFNKQKHEWIWQIYIQEPRLFILCRFAFYTSVPRLQTLCWNLNRMGVVKTAVFFKCSTALCWPSGDPVTVFGPDVMEGRGHDL